MNPSEGWTFTALLFHAVESAAAHVPRRVARDAESVVPVKLFVGLLDWLERERYTTLTTADLAPDNPALLESPERTVMLTFDDGWITDLRNVLPALLDRGMRGVFFVPWGSLNQRGRLSCSDALALHQAGMELASHTVSHRRLPDLRANELGDELVTSKEQLENLIGAEVLSLSVPEGQYDLDVVEHAWAAGYRAIFTADGGVNRLRLDDSLFGRCTVRPDHTVRDLVALVRPDATQRRARESLRQAADGFARLRSTRPEGFFGEHLLAAPRWMGSGSKNRKP